jgi:hypothetical protein
MVFLLLCTTPFVVEAQQFECWPIVRGDTASGLARRLTGKAAAAYSDAFQIKDPTRRRFVPKSRYGRLSTHWQACVVRKPVKSNLLALAPAAAPPAASQAVPPLARGPAITSSRVITRSDVIFAVTIAAAVWLMLVMISAVAGYASTPPIPPAMLRAAAEDFIRVFARPLVDPLSGVAPIAVRLRFVRRVQQLEICIAPCGGRRYPNLSDHKKNVEYDVNRVVRTVGTHRVVADRLRAEGKWVVVPIRLTH